MTLASGQLYDTTVGIVNVPSVEAAGILRVKRRASAASYLINKIEGTQAQVGGSGAQMPSGSGANYVGSLEFMAP